MSAEAREDIPITAEVYSEDGELLARASNRKEEDCDPTAHAEVLAIREAARKLKTPNLQGCKIWTTLEPCIMCAGAILNAKISRVEFGAWDEKFGASGSVWDLLRDPRAPFHPEVFGGVRANEHAAKLGEFFRKVRRGSPKIAERIEAS